MFIVLKVYEINNIYLYLYNNQVVMVFLLLLNISAFVKIISKSIVYWSFEFIGL